MRILIINHYFITPDRFGGTRHYQLAKALQSRGHQVEIVASNFNHFSLCYQSFSCEGLNVYSIPCRAYQKNGVKRLLNMLDFCRGVKKLKLDYQPDVILASSPHLLAGAAGLTLAKRYQSRFVLEIRDLWPETFVQLKQMSRWHPIVLWFKYLEAKLYRHADVIFHLLPFAHEYKSSRCKQVYLPNFVDIRKKVFHKQSRKSGPFTFLYSGSHGLSNDLTTLLYAAQRLEENGVEKFCIRCIGEGTHKKQLMALADRLNLKSIQFEGPIPKSDIPTILSQADAFILCVPDSPLYHWGYSMNKCFDYLLAGKPIIYSGNSRFDLVQNAKAGISVPATDAEAMAKAMTNCAFELTEFEREQMGRNGQNYVHENHDVQVITERFLVECEIRNMNSSNIEMTADRV